MNDKNTIFGRELIPSHLFLYFFWDDSITLINQNNTEKNIIRIKSNKIAYELMEVWENNNLERVKHIHIAHFFTDRELGLINYYQ